MAWISHNCRIKPLKQLEYVYIIPWCVRDLSLNQTNTNNDSSKGSLRNKVINSVRSILAVDDEYDIVNLIKLSLEIDRQRVCIFTDPLTALAHFNDSDPKDYHHIVIFLWEDQYLTFFSPNFKRTSIQDLKFSKIGYLFLPPLGQNFLTKELIFMISGFTDYQ